MASHFKNGGMKGSGALYIRNGLRAEPLLRGGGQEKGLRSGTEATPQIAAFAAAVEVRRSAGTQEEAVRALKDYALETLVQIQPPQP